MLAAVGGGPTLVKKKLRPRASASRRYILREGYLQIFDRPLLSYQVNASWPPDHKLSCSWRGSLVKEAEAGLLAVGGMLASARR
jgi:hypothetical protein